MKYSSAISARVLGTVERKPAVSATLYKCPRCKSYDEINLKNSYEWLAPFEGYVQTPLCWVCISELRRELRRK